MQSHPLPHPAPQRRGRALLRALPAVGGAAAARFGREALPVVAHTHVAVHEDLDVGAGHRRRHRSDVVDRQLTGEYDGARAYAEYTNIRAGIRHCAVSSEHRANTREATTVNTAEYGRIQLNTCPLERYLIYKNLSRF